MEFDLRKKMQLKHLKLIQEILGINPLHANNVPIQKNKLWVEVGTYKQLALKEMEVLGLVKSWKEPHPHIKPKNYLLYYATEKGMKMMGKRNKLRNV